MLGYRHWILGSALLIMACQMASPPTRPRSIEKAADSPVTAKAKPPTPIPPEVEAELDEPERQAITLGQTAPESENVTLAADPTTIDPVTECRGNCHLELELAKTVPLRYQQWLGSHNAYNSKGIFKNQFWNITQQLNAGLRVLELDLHGRLLLDKVRVCHGISANTCLLNPLGVRNYQELLTEIKTWSDRHPDQLLIIELENHVKKEKSVLQPLQNTFKELIYANSERPIGWHDETPAQILAKGKRIIVADFGGNRFDKKLIWDENELFTNNQSQDFQPGCKVKEQSMGDKLWGFYDDKTYHKGNPMTPANIAEFLNCHARYLKIDRLNTQILEATRFTWDQSRLPSGESCASLGARHSRWQAHPCAKPARAACLGTPNRYEWKITAKQGNWSEAESLCQGEFGPEFHFDVPRTYYQQERLKSALPDSISTVWLNYRTSR